MAWLHAIDAESAFFCQREKSRLHQPADCCLWRQVKTEDMAKFHAEPVGSCRSAKKAMCSKRRRNIRPPHPVMATPPQRCLSTLAPVNRKPVMVSIVQSPNLANISCRLGPSRPCRQTDRATAQPRKTGCGWLGSQSRPHRNPGCRQDGLRHELAKDFAHDIPRRLAGTAR